MTTRPPRALVVDDSDTIRSLIVLNLVLEGFEVHEAADGAACLATAAQLRPDVITLDVRMPKVDGFTVVERLSADPATADIPVVMVTARAQGSDLQRGLALGVAAYVTKPFDPTALVDTVRSAMQRREPQ